MRYAAALLVGVLAGLAACGGAPKRGASMHLTMESIDGGTISLAEARGRVVVLHVFAGWSLAAQGDVPQLVELARTEKRALVIGVGVDPEGRQVLAPWRDANQIPYLIVDADRTEPHYGPPLDTISQVPTTIVLDPAGRLVARIERPLTDGELVKLVRRALSGR